MTPTAEFESNYIAAQILGISDAPISYPVIPNLVFTLPRIGQVGVTMDEAKAAAGFYRNNGYKEYGDIEDEEGCPHIWMMKEKLDEQEER